MKIPRLVACAFAIAFTVAPAAAQGIVDQQYAGPFDFAIGIAGINDAQSFTPTQNNIVGVDLFLVPNAGTTSAAYDITVWIGGAGAPTTITLPAGISGSVASPYVAHVAFDSPVAVTPGVQYHLFVHAPVFRSFGGIAVVNSDQYPGGNAMQGGFNVTWADWGFRTYYLPELASLRADLRALIEGLTIPQRADLLAKVDSLPDFVDQATQEHREKLVARMSELKMVVERQTSRGKIPAATGADILRLADLVITALIGPDAP